ncbi:MAG: hypothetical protein RLO21_18035, partial [Nitratireductor sp.]
MNAGFHKSDRATIVLLPLAGRSASIGLCECGQTGLLNAQVLTHLGGLRNCSNLRHESWRSSRNPRGTECAFSPPLWAYS